MGDQSEQDTQTKQMLEGENLSAEKFSRLLAGPCNKNVNAYKILKEKNFQTFTKVFQL